MTDGNSIPTPGCVLIRNLTILAILSIEQRDNLSWLLTIYTSTGYRYCRYRQSSVTYWYRGQGLVPFAVGFAMGFCEIVNSSSIGCLESVFHVPILLNSLSGQVHRLNSLSGQVYRVL